MISNQQEAISRTMTEIKQKQKEARSQVLGQKIVDKYNKLLKDTEGTKIKLFIDADDVIMDTSKAIIDKYNMEFKDNLLYVPVTKKDVWDWGYKEPCPLAPPEFFENFFSSRDDIMSITPMPWSKQTLTRLNKIYDIYVVTIGVKENIVAKTEWFSKYFPFLDKIIFMYHNDCKMDKSAINMARGVFVDDNGDNLKSSNADIKITFGDVREYNRGQELRAYDMTELEGFLVNVAHDVRYGKEKE